MHVRVARDDARLPPAHVVLEAPADRRDNRAALARRDAAVLNRDVEAQRGGDLVVESEPPHVAQRARPITGERDLVLDRLHLLEAAQHLEAVLEIARQRAAVARARLRPSPLGRALQGEQAMDLVGSVVKGLRDELGHARFDDAQHLEQAATREREAGDAPRQPRAVPVAERARVTGSLEGRAEGETAPEDRGHGPLRDQPPALVRDGAVDRELARRLPRSHGDLRLAAEDAIGAIGRMPEPLEAALKDHDLRCAQQPALLRLAIQHRHGIHL